jgi:hypothetical protein
LLLFVPTLLQQQKIAFISEINSTSIKDMMINLRELIQDNSSYSVDNSRKIMPSSRASYSSKMDYDILLTDIVCSIGNII